jgi:NAD(P)-dependent dehydrogenase (short-subunit alcohol dehydrogenase family)
MNGKICVVTGANTGIGRATAEELTRRGAHVVMVCRSRERAEQARAEIERATGSSALEVVVADLSLMSEVRRAAGEIASKHPRIDVLVNNAAVFLPAREETAEGLEKTFATNYLSHYLLTRLLLPNLETAGNARIVNVATLTRGLKIDLDDLQLTKQKYSVFGAVGPTKLALILFTKELARRLEGTKVTVNALHPGLVKTPLLDDVGGFMRFVSHLFSTTPEKGARTPVFLATSPEVAGVTGKLFADCKEVVVKGPAADPAIASRLWDLSASLAKVPAEGRAAV